MAPYTKTTWADEVPASTPVKYSITGDVEGEISASAEIAVVTSVTPGTALNAANLNHMEDGIEDAQDAADAAQADADTAQAAADAAQTAADLVQDNLDDTNALIDLMRTHVIITFASQSIPDSTLTKVLFDTVSGSDPDGFFDAVNNQIKIPAGFDGFYTLIACAYWTSHVTAGTKRQMDIQIGGSTKAAITIPAIGGEAMWMNVVYAANLAAGNTVRVSAQQKSGGSLTLYDVKLFIIGKK
jgi:multidrug efflux pump subunit AcrA (membrane-fusion protein)